MYSEQTSFRKRLDSFLHIQKNTFATKPKTCTFVSTVDYSGTTRAQRDAGAAMAKVRQVSWLKEVRI